uniref:dehydrogenase/reductase SDR family member 4-like isoform X2 n=1 Tax=Myxine glutinosa TaxID=7769 RepID=UPI00358FEC3B
MILTIIGYSVARRLAFDGASVMVSSRKESNVSRAVQTLLNQGLNVAGTVCHAGQEEDRARLLEKTQHTFGGIDIVVCNVAINPFVGNILESTGEMWDKILDVNVKCTFLFAKESVPYMKKRGGGSVVIVSSVAGYQPLPGIGPYNVSKSALLGLIKELAPALADHNIRVNCLAPGIIRTKFSSFIWSNEDNLKKLVEKIPLKRMGEPDECAGIVSFLCSPDASYITGESVIVAGGLFSRL